MEAEIKRIVWLLICVSAMATALILLAEGNVFISLVSMLVSGVAFGKFT